MTVNFTLLVELEELSFSFTCFTADNAPTLLFAVPLLRRQVPRIRLRMKKRYEDGLPKLEQLNLCSNSQCRYRNATQFSAGTFRCMLCSGTYTVIEEKAAYASRLHSEWQRNGEERRQERAYLEIRSRQQHQDEPRRSKREGKVLRPSDNSKPPAVVKALASPPPPPPKVDPMPLPIRLPKTKDAPLPAIPSLRASPSTRHVHRTVNVLEIAARFEPPKSPGSEATMHERMLPSTSSRAQSPVGVASEIVPPGASKTAPRPTKLEPKSDSPVQDSKQPDRFQKVIEGTYSGEKLMATIRERLRSTEEDDEYIYGSNPLLNQHRGLSPRLEHHRC